jgi:hypothetical protein
MSPTGVLVSPPPARHRLFVVLFPPLFKSSFLTCCGFLPSMEVMNFFPHSLVVVSSLPQQNSTPLHSISDELLVSSLSLSLSLSLVTLAELHFSS